MKANPLKLYELVSENLTGLGGPMDSEHTWTNWRKYCKDIKQAKELAQKDYGDEKIEWIRTKTGLRSPDLGYVMYHINRIQTEK